MPTKSDRSNDRLFISRMVGVTFKNRGSKLYPTRNTSSSGMYIAGQLSYLVGSPCTVKLHEVGQVDNLLYEPFRQRDKGRQGRLGLLLY
jgi:hypothetical protein